jgi:hypothetical protein
MLTITYLTFTPVATMLTIKHSKRVLCIQTKSQKVGGYLRGNLDFVNHTINIILSLSRDG